MSPAEAQLLLAQCYLPSEWLIGRQWNTSGLLSSTSEWLIGREWNMSGLLSSTSEWLIGREWNTSGLLSSTSQWLIDREWNTSGLLSSTSEWLIDREWNTSGLLSSTSEWLIDRQWNTSGLLSNWLVLVESLNLVVDSIVSSNWNVEIPNLVLLVVRGQVHGIEQLSTRSYINRRTVVIHTRLMSD